MRIVHILLWLVAAYKLGDWRNWKLYYPTWLFWLAGNLIYSVIFNKWRLWLYVDPIFKSDTAVTFFDSFFEYFCVLLIFLPHYPKILIKQFLYIGLWVGIFTTIEAVFVISGHLAYYHGWNLAWSAVHNIYMFPLLILHYKNHQALVWGISFVILVIVALIFGAPLPQ